MRSPFLVRFLAAAVFSIDARFAVAQEKSAADSEKLRHEKTHGLAPSMLRPEPFPDAKEITPPKNETELAAAIGKLGDKVAAAGRFSGAVLLAIDGKPLIEKAWGLADRDRKIAKTSETAFDIGSLGKLITQVAILRLVDAGKLSLDEPFGEYLPDYQIVM